MIARSPFVVHRIREPLSLLATILAISASTTSHTIGMSFGRDISEFPPNGDEVPCQSKIPSLKPTETNRPNHTKTRTFARFATGKSIDPRQIVTP